MEYENSKLDERLLAIEDYIPKTLEGDVIRQLVDSKVGGSAGALEEKINNLGASVTKKINNIYSQHLWKHKVIGPDEKCKSLMEYVLQQIPTITDRLKKAGDDAVQGLFLIK